MIVVRTRTARRQKTLSTEILHRKCTEIGSAITIMQTSQAFDMKPQIQQSGFDMRLKPKCVQIPVGKGLC